MAGSFTLVAKQLNTSTSYVSMQLGALEVELNFQLVQRTTRTLTFTDAGKRFALYCEQMFDLMHDTGVNIGTMAVLIGGLGSIVPERREFIAKHGFRAIVAGVFANLMSTAIASVILSI